MWTGTRNDPRWNDGEWVEDDNGFGSCDLTLDGYTVARILERVDGYQAKIISSGEYSPEMPFRQQVIEWVVRRGAETP